MAKGICENNAHTWVKRPTYDRRHNERCSKCNITKYGRLHARRLEKLFNKWASHTVLLNIVK